MQVFEFFPETDEGKKIFLQNLAIFKTQLLLKSIDNLNISDKAKDDVLEKVLEILDNRPNDSTI